MKFHIIEQGSYYRVHFEGCVARAGERFEDRTLREIVAQYSRNPLASKLFQFAMARSGAFYEQTVGQVYTIRHEAGCLVALGQTSWELPSDCASIRSKAIWDLATLVRAGAKLDVRLHGMGTPPCTPELGMVAPLQTEFTLRGFLIEPAPAIAAESSDDFERELELLNEQLGPL